MITWSISPVLSPNLTLRLALHWCNAVQTFPKTKIHFYWGGGGEFGWYLAAHKLAGSRADLDFDRLTPAGGWGFFIKGCSLNKRRKGANIMYAGRAQRCQHWFFACNRKMTDTLLWLVFYMSQGTLSGGSPRVCTICLILFSCLQSWPQYYPCLYVMNRTQ